MLHIPPISPCIFPICAAFFTCVKSSKSVPAFSPFRYRKPDSLFKKLLPDPSPASRARSLRAHLFNMSRRSLRGPLQPGRSQRFFQQTGKSGRLPESCRAQAGLNLASIRTIHNRAKRALNEHSITELSSRAGSGERRQIQFLQRGRTDNASRQEP